MPNYRRNFVPGGTCFFTCVTHHRRLILTTDLGRECLRKAIFKVQNNQPFEFVAVVKTILNGVRISGTGTLESVNSCHRFVNDGEYDLAWSRVAHCLAGMNQNGAKKRKV